MKHSPCARHDLDIGFELGVQNDRDAEGGKRPVIAFEGESDARDPAAEPAFRFAPAEFDAGDVCVEFHSGLSVLGLATHTVEPFAAASMVPLLGRGGVAACEVRA